MIPRKCKRLAQVDFPIAEVSRHSAREKSFLLTPNERRVAEDRRNYYWLYVVTHCNSVPILQEPIRDPTQFPRHEVMKVQHYYLDVDAMTRPIQVLEDAPPYGGEL